MSKPIKSTDPRKPAIVEAMKRKANATKITNLREVSPGLYEGTAMRGNPNGRGFIFAVPYGHVLLTDAELKGDSPKSRMSELVFEAVAYLKNHNGGYVKGVDSVEWWSDLQDKVVMGEQALLDSKSAYYLGWLMGVTDASYDGTLIETLDAEGLI